MGVAVGGRLCGEIRLFVVSRDRSLAAMLRAVTALQLFNEMTFKKGYGFNLVNCRLLVFFND
jgi:hypothetical protein